MPRQSGRQSRSFDGGPEAGERSAQTLVLDPGQRCRNTLGRLRVYQWRGPPFGFALERGLPERQPADRPPAQEDIYALKNDARHVLDFDRRRALYPQHQGGGFRIVGIGLPRPLDFHRLGESGDLAPDDILPMGYQLDRGEALTRKAVGQKLAGNIAKPAGLSFAGLVHGTLLCHIDGA